jgi:hypothetical protein
MSTQLSLKVVIEEVIQSSWSVWSASLVPRKKIDRSWTFRRSSSRGKDGPLIPMQTDGCGGLVQRSCQGNPLHLLSRVRGYPGYTMFQSKRQETGESPGGGP